MKKLKHLLILTLVSIVSACSTLNPYMEQDEHIATADWTPGDTEKAAAAIADKIISGKKLKAYIEKRPNGETTLYLAQLENKTDRSDMDSARVALNAALKEKLLNEAEGFNVIDPENKAVAKEMARTRGGSVRTQDVIQAAQKLGADTLITGIISGDRHDVGNKTYQEYTFDLQILETKTTKVLGSAHYSVKKQQKAAKIKW